jgi:hypothetical protein
MARERQRLERERLERERLENEVARERNEWVVILGLLGSQKDS